MKSISVSTVVIVLLASIAALAQEPQDLFCNAGLRPNGYIDFSSLPAATFPSGSAPSAPVTATLPVQGVPGLTVTVTIPSLQNSLGSGPVYTVTGGTLQLNGVPASSTSYGLIILQFSQPVVGLGLITSTQGRFGDTFTLMTDMPGAGLTGFVNSASNFSNYFEQAAGLPLQMVDLSGTFQTASVTFNGNEYYSATLSDFRIQSAPAPEPKIPTEGLQQWLRTDASIGSIGTVGTWPDASGHGHDATQTVLASQPILVPDGQTCLPSYLFSGSQFFNFTLPIDGWDKMTIFLAGKSQLDPPGSSEPSDAAAIYWQRSGPGAGTFVTPYQTHEPFRFATAQSGNHPIYTRPVTIGQDFTISRAVHDRTVDSLRVNGVEVLRHGGKLPNLSGTTGAGTIGKSSKNTYFNGEISEILVYNRVLSENEATEVESYLRSKYGLH